jgi:5-methylcytosine-specific restriction endonuclease McrA
MANPWFRLYAEFASDPKVQMLSEPDQRRYVMLMCLRCSNVTETLHEAEIAFALRITEDQLAETKKLFVARGFIDDKWNLINWDKRQFVSDSSYERVKRHRQKRADSGLPKQNFIPKSLRDAVYDRDGNACVYCQSTEDLTIDHDLPQSRGGTDEADNLLTACRSCNASKRDLTYSEFIERNSLVTLQKRKSNSLYTDKYTESNTDKPKTFTPLAALVSLGVSKKIASDWLKIRKAKKQVLTETALDGVVLEANKAGLSMDAAIKKCCENSWAGFKASWLTNDGKPNQFQTKNERIAENNSKAIAEFVGEEKTIEGEVIDGR